MLARVNLFRDLGVNDERPQRVQDLLDFQGYKAIRNMREQVAISEVTAWLTTGAGGKDRRGREEWKEGHTLSDSPGAYPCHWYFLPCSSLKLAVFARLTNGTPNSFLSRTGGSSPTFTLSSRKSFQYKLATNSPPVCVFAVDDGDGSVLGTLRTVVTVPLSKVVSTE